MNDRTTVRDQDAIEQEPLPALLPLDEHNRTLRSHVHPPSWTDPTPSGRYNLVVIGGGTAGLVTAAGAAGLGAKVALVERDLLGGDCLNVGCVPSKALIRCARAAADVRSAGRYGIAAGGEPQVDFGAVMERMRRIRASIAPHDGAERLRSLGIDVFLGHGRFEGPDSVRVGEHSLRFARAAVATGARAVALPIPGLAEAGYLTNETVFSLTDLPRRLAVIGAGPIGCEMAQAFARLGSQVTLIESESRILVREDPDAAAIVERALHADGIEIRCGGKTVEVRREGTERVLELDCEGERITLRADQILLGVGRAPNVEGMGLEDAGIDFGPRGIAVDDRLRTTNRRVFAAGDVCSQYKFTHAADAMARIVIQNALFFGRATVSALTIPWATYTDPELAHVGLYEAEARERGIDVTTIRVPFSEIDRAVLDGDEEGLLQVHLEGSSDKILGATLVARHAGDMIAELSLAMTAGLGLRSIAKTIHPYPTQAEAIKKAGDKYNRTRLTPRVESLFTRFLAWRR